jgi:hypothetical protein
MIERLKTAAFAEDQDVGMALRDQERGLGCTFRDDSIDRVGGAVNEGSSAT